MGAAILRAVAIRVAVAAVALVREVCIHDRVALGRHRSLLPGRQQGRSGLRRITEQPHPYAATPSLRLSRRRLLPAEDPDVHAAGTIITSTTKKPEEPYFYWSQ